ncbi:hypothetical protein [Microvirga calopogonii]|uniref:hypothetical protein n=1 Tax=Microvirga calopogonii TaxID=2078013 RepID=UPI0013B44B60|nr:hypothetical protein [Microvirga calopogonii]
MPSSFGFLPPATVETGDDPQFNRLTVGDDEFRTTRTHSHIALEKSLHRNPGKNGIERDTDDIPDHTPRPDGRIMGGFIAEQSVEHFYLLGFVPGLSYPLYGIVQYRSGF